MTMLVGYAWGKRYTSMQSELLLVIARRLVAHAELIFSLQRSDAHNRHRSGSHGGRSSQGRHQLSSVIAISMARH